MPRNSIKFDASRHHCGGFTTMSLGCVEIGRNQDLCRLSHVQSHVAYFPMVSIRIFIAWFSKKQSNYILRFQEDNIVWLENHGVCGEDVWFCISGENPETFCQPFSGLVDVFLAHPRRLTESWLPWGRTGLPRPGRGPKMTFLSH